MTIKKELKNLSSNDIYSLLLFALYKFRNIPEYSSLSELIYILDKDSLLKLCEYYGGLTLRIPTIDELESILNIIILYQYVNIEKMDYEVAIKKLDFKTTDLRKIKSDYNKLCSLLDKYSFDR